MKDDDSPDHYSDDFDEKEKRINLVEPAWAKAAHYFRTDAHYGHGDYSRRFRGMVELHDVLESKRKRYEKGELHLLLQAVAFCAAENLPMPEWVAHDFQVCWRQYFDFKGKAYSLDEAFLERNLTKKQVATAKQDRQSGYPIHREVRLAAKAASDAGTPKSFHATVKAVLLTKKWGVCLTKAKALVKMVEQIHIDGNPHYQALSRFWAKP